ncbi:MAG: aldehyde ferredoxin oxidoreductase N-terminal domain-containing protein [Bellilinea sp.]
MSLYTPEMIREAHRVLAEYAYELRPVGKGYANRTLYVNVGDKTILEKPVDDIIKSTFTGGKGFGLWLLWNGIKEDTLWDSPENELVIAASGNRGKDGSGASLARRSKEKLVDAVNKRRGWTLDGEPPL